MRWVVTFESSEEISENVDVRLQHIANFLRRLLLPSGQSDFLSKCAAC